MSDRIKQEMDLLQEFYPSIKFNGNWGFISNYQLPKSSPWDENKINVSFQFPQGYPGAKPYGIFVPKDLTINGQQPDRFKQNPDNNPPFEGNWGVLSWSPKNWEPAANIKEGDNMLNFVQSFRDRFESGK